MLRWLVILSGCLCFSAAVAYWQTEPNPRPRRPDVPIGDVNVYKPKQVLKEPIRPITDPTIVSAVETTVAPNELVLGVEVGGDSRAYPINQLTGPQREIINDVLGGTAIAATW